MKLDQYPEPQNRINGKLEQLIVKLGFPPLKSVATLPSIAHLFGSTRSRCGIYLLTFQNGAIYIGQAFDVVHRFASHRRTYRDITGFAFIIEKKLKLDETERNLIRRAERLGLTLLNVVHTSEVVGDTDLDLVFPAEKQQEWLSHPELSKT